MAVCIDALDYDALDDALTDSARLTLPAPALKELSVTRSYARIVILHALRGERDDAFYAALGIARQGWARFSYDPELKHLAYSALAEGLLQLLALTPRAKRPDLRRSGESSRHAELRLCDTIAALYGVAQDSLASRISLRAATDGVIAERRENLDARLGNVGPDVHARFARLLSADIVSLANAYLAAQTRAEEEAHRVATPFRAIARDPDAHVRYLRTSLAKFIGTSPDTFTL